MDHWRCGRIRCLGCLRHARLKVVVFQPIVVSSFRCFVFKFWVLHFQDLGASFSNFGCFVFEIWVLRASVLFSECFVPSCKHQFSVLDNTCTSATLHLQFIALAWALMIAFWFTSGSVVFDKRDNLLFFRILTMWLAILAVPFLPASNIFFTVGFVLAEGVLYLSSIGSSLITVQFFDLPH